MSDVKKEPEVAALEAVYAALKLLDPAVRQRVLASAYALLEMTPVDVRSPTAAPVPGPTAPQRSSARPLSLIELMNDKKPSAYPERITLFAYYRDRYEGKPRFARDDLEPYFALAKIPPPGNFARDFTEAVRRAWIHEDGSDSYITSKGIEAVEAGFPQEAAAASAGRPRKKKKQKAKKARR